MPEGYGKYGTLVNELMRRNVPVPAGIRDIVKGSFGVAIIGADTVLKVFYRPLKGNFGPQHKTGVFKAALRGLEGISSAAAELTEKHIEVPQLLAHDSLREPFFAHGHEYYAWMLMPRLEGVAKKTHGPSTKFLNWLGMRDMAILAAQLHSTNRYPAPPDKKIIDVLTWFAIDRKAVWPDEHGRFQGVKRVRPAYCFSKKNAALLPLIRADITRHMPENGVPLHGDLHPWNVLKKSDGRKGVIDWDFRSMGPAEIDLWKTALDQPARIPSLCRVYNDASDYKVSPVVVAGYALSGVINQYEVLTKGKQDYGSKYSAHGQRFLRGLAMRMAELSEVMYTMTGNPAYASAAKRFKKGYPHLQKNPNRPISPANNKKGKPLTAHK